MATEVTDPALLAQLNGPAPGGQEVTDPALLAQLNGTPAPRAEAPPPQQSSSGFPSFAEFASAAIRPIAKGIAALPLMAADAGVAAGNLINGKIDFSHASLAHPMSWLGQNTPDAYPLPSTTFNQTLDNYTQAPATGLGKAAEFVSSSLVGSRIPTPTGVQQAPEEFGQAAQQMRNAVLQKSQDAGYVVPPATSNPTFTNNLLTGISGKLKLAQEASVRNQAVTDRLSALGIGQNPDAPLTQGALSTIRSSADSSGYAPVRAAGEMLTDQPFLDKVAALGQAGEGAARMGIRQPSPFDAVMGQSGEDAKGLLGLSKFNAADGLDSIKYLRSQADDAFGAGNASLGRQYKGAAAALEDLIERNLVNQGEDGAGLLNKFRAARTLMAQTYTAGKAMVGDTGMFNAKSYANQLASGTPLVGEQKTIADFATQFPKAARLMQEDVPSVSPLDMYGSMIASGATHSSAPLLGPLTRVGIREYLLSQAGQARAIQAIKSPDQTLGVLSSAIPQAGLAGLY